MKWIIRLFILSVLLVLGLLAFGWFYVNGTAPQYNGEVNGTGIVESVDVLYDNYGIPHIYGTNEADVFFALGYVTAQDRLFQMDMMRRTAAGTLSEILGEATLEADRYFRTIGLNVSAEKMAKLYLSDDQEDYQKNSKAYLKGVNHFIDNNRHPVEYDILQFKPEYFTDKDIFLLQSIMAIGFAEAFREEPLIAQISSQLGADYLKDFSVYPDSTFVTNTFYREQERVKELSFNMKDMLEGLPVSLFRGSNSWVVSGEKSKTGKPILCNDPHIGFRKPDVWYEAYLEAGDFSFYGNFLSGSPFGVIGSNRFCGWGVTMFENDDADFYREKLNPEDSTQYWVIDHWEKVDYRKEIIPVNGQATDTLWVRSTRHGPIINDVVTHLHPSETAPLAFWWTYFQRESNTLKAIYDLSKVQSMGEMEDALSRVHAPGLNFTYADTDGNIAWYGVAHMVKRPDSTNSKMILDGASGKDDPIGFYPFSENPQSVNPPSGFVYSANQQAAMNNGEVYPGYYTQSTRAERIVTRMNEQEKWSKDDLRKLFIDDIDPEAVDNANEMMRKVNSQNEVQKQALDLLQKWDGTHKLNEAAPTIYWQWLNTIIQETVGDELGEDAFAVMRSCHLMRRTYKKLIANNESVWWDNTSTKDIKETRETILQKSFETAITNLQSKMGDNADAWKWGEMHTLTLGHPLGEVPPLDKVFNIGPNPCLGSNAVLNNTGFEYDTLDNFAVNYGPSTRMMIDLSDPAKSLGVLPSGQSGNIKSPYYSDQVDLYLKGELRPRLMNRSDVEAVLDGKLVLMP